MTSKLFVSRSKTTFRKNTFRKGDVKQLNEGLCLDALNGNLNIN